MEYDCVGICIKWLCGCDAVMLMQLYTKYHWPSMSISCLNRLIRKLNVNVNIIFIFSKSMDCDCGGICIKRLRSCDAVMLMQLYTKYHWPSISGSSLNGLIRKLNIKFVDADAIAGKAKPNSLLPWLSHKQKKKHSSFY